ncbi:hypothetical protein PHLCEN_2v1726 [Hermanssonia centrifuga]|uniref:CFEM domain-containing protein n=1 Tax=Hermanssonia centrifuga TaxID=98765 RepID=A0A2R6RW15_9APHY|nr:hypothetical protein PHLCEN_2v1726 [Hermanssonia centrifuga]
MRFSLAAFFLTAAVSTASAATLFPRQSFPTCSDDCILNPPNLFGCDSNDNKCLCSSTQYVAATTACIASACSAQDAASADSLSQSLCEQVGITLTATSTSSSSAPSSSSTAPSGSSSSGGSPAASSSSDSSPPSSSSTAPTPTPTTNAAMSAGTNTFVGLAALLLAALNL